MEYKVKEKESEIKIIVLRCEELIKENDELKMENFIL